MPQPLLVAGHYGPFSRSRELSCERNGYTPALFSPHMAFTLTVYISFTLCSTLVFSVMEHEDQPTARLFTQFMYLLQEPSIYCYTKLLVKGSPHGNYSSTTQQRMSTRSLSWLKRSLTVKFRQIVQLASWYLVQGNLLCAVWGPLAPQRHTQA